MFRHAKREHGGSSSEYALLVALIAAVCLVGMQILGTSVSGLFTIVNNAWP